MFFERLRGRIMGLAGEKLVNLAADDECSATLAGGFKALKGALIRIRSKGTLSIIPGSAGKKILVLSTSRKRIFVQSLSCRECNQSDSIME